jgi:hypothetical protein
MGLFFLLFEVRFDYGGSARQPAAGSDAFVFTFSFCCMNEPFVHGLTLREEGQVELWEWPNELSAGGFWAPATDGVNAILREIERVAALQNRFELCAFAPCELALDVWWPSRSGHENQNHPSIVFAFYCFARLDFWPTFTASHRQAALPD